MRMFHFVIALSVATQPAAAQVPSRDSPPATPQPRPRPGVERGAAIMGIVGAVALGLAGAALSQGICDAADCSGAWREGVGLGTVFGAFAGGALGALGGLAGTTTAEPGDPGRLRGPRLRLTSGVGFASNQSDVRTLGGVAAAFELPVAGPLGVELQAEYFGGGGGWRGAGVTPALVVNAGWDRLRVRWQAGLGGFTWRNPGYVSLNDPRFPGAMVQGQVRDSYIRPVLGFGVACDPAPGWRLHGEVRWHHRGVRDDLGEGSFVFNRSWAPFTVGVSRRL